MDRLYQLVKELDSTVNKTEGRKGKEKEKEMEQENSCDSNLIKTIEEHSKLIKESNVKINELKNTIERYEENQARTYASVVTQGRQTSYGQKALHSVVITSKIEEETGDQVMERIRKAVNAKSGEVVVESTNLPPQYV